MQTHLSMGSHSFQVYLPEIRRPLWLQSYLKKKSTEKSLISSDNDDETNGDSDVDSLLYLEIVNDETCVVFANVVGNFSSHFRLVHTLFELGGKAILAYNALLEPYQPPKFTGLNTKFFPLNDFFNFAVSSRTVFSEVLDPVISDDSSSNISCIDSDENVSSDSYRTKLLAKLRQHGAIKGFSGFSFHAPSLESLNSVYSILSTFYSLNSIQSKVLQSVVSSKSNKITLVQGPPGTGKTFISAVIMHALLAVQMRTHCVAQTNFAIAEVARKFVQTCRLAINPKRPESAGALQCYFDLPMRSQSDFFFSASFVADQSTMHFPRSSDAPLKCSHLLSMRLPSMRTFAPLAILPQMAALSARRDRVEIHDGVGALWTDLRAASLQGACRDLMSVLSLLDAAVETRHVRMRNKESFDEVFDVLSGGISDLFKRVTNLAGKSLISDEESTPTSTVNLTQGSVRGMSFDLPTRLPGETSGVALCLSWTRYLTKMLAVMGFAPICTMHDEKSFFRAKEICESMDDFLNEIELDLSDELRCKSKELSEELHRKSNQLLSKVMQLLTVVNEDTDETKFNRSHAVVSIPVCFELVTKLSTLASSLYFYAAAASPSGYPDGGSRAELLEAMNLVAECHFNGEAQQAYFPDACYHSCIPISVRQEKVRVGCGKLKTIAREVSRVVRGIAFYISESNFLSQNLVSDCLVVHAALVFTTVASGSRSLIKSQLFSALIVDEAFQILEPDLIPCMKFTCQRIVLVGDHLQLPPSPLTASMFASSLLDGASESNNVLANPYGIKYMRPLFARLMQSAPDKFNSMNGGRVIMLCEQHRMLPDISVLPSSKVYGHLLRDSKSVCERTSIWRERSLFPPFAIFNIASLGPLGVLHNESSGRLLPDCILQNPSKGISNSDVRQSLINTAEVNGAISLLESFWRVNKERLVQPTVDEGKPFSIMILTLYSGQKLLMQSAVDAAFTSPLRELITVCTVDGSQGREASLVILSPVRSNTQGSLGFIADPRRINVAVSRARWGLWIVGDMELMKRHRFSSQQMQTISWKDVAAGSGAVFELGERREMLHAIMHSTFTNPIISGQQSNLNSGNNNGLQNNNGIIPSSTTSQWFDTKANAANMPPNTSNTSGFLKHKEKDFYLSQPITEPLLNINTPANHAEIASESCRLPVFLSTWLLAQLTQIPVACPYLRNEENVLDLFTSTLLEWIQGDLGDRPFTHVHQASTTSSFQQPLSTKFGPLFISVPLFPRGVASTRSVHEKQSDIPQVLVSPWIDFSAGSGAIKAWAICGDFKEAAALSNRIRDTMSTLGFKFFTEDSLNDDCLAKYFRMPLGATITARNDLPNHAGVLLKKSDFLNVKVRTTSSNLMANLVQTLLSWPLSTFMDSFSEHELITWSSVDSPTATQGGAAAQLRTVTNWCMRDRKLLGYFMFYGSAIMANGIRIANEESVQVLRNRFLSVKCYNNLSWVTPQSYASRPALRNCFSNLTFALNQHPSLLLAAGDGNYPLRLLAQSARPQIIFGMHGSGKTSILMDRIAKCELNWMKQSKLHDISNATDVAIQLFVLPSNIAPDVSKAFIRRLDTRRQLQYASEAIDGFPVSVLIDDDDFQLLPNCLHDLFSVGWASIEPLLPQLNWHSKLSADAFLSHPKSVISTPACLASSIDNNLGILSLRNIRKNKKILNFSTFFELIWPKLALLHSRDLNLYFRDWDSQQSALTIYTEIRAGILGVASPALLSILYNHSNPNISDINANSVFLRYLMWIHKVQETSPTQHPLLISKETYSAYRQSRNVLLPAQPLPETVHHGSLPLFSLAPLSPHPHFSVSHCELVYNMCMTYVSILVEEGFIDSCELVIHALACGWAQPDLGAFAAAQVPQDLIQALKQKPPPYVFADTSSIDCGEAVMQTEMLLVAGLTKRMTGMSTANFPSHGVRMSVAANILPLETEVCMHHAAIFITASALQSSTPIPWQSGDPISYLPPSFLFQPSGPASPSRRLQFAAELLHSRYLSGLPNPLLSIAAACNPESAPKSPQTWVSTLAKSLGITPPSNRLPGEDRHLDILNLQSIFDEDIPLASQLMFRSVIKMNLDVLSILNSSTFSSETADFLSNENTHSHMKSSLPPPLQLRNFAKDIDLRVMNLAEVLRTSQTGGCIERTLVLTTNERFAFHLNEIWNLKQAHESRATHGYIEKGYNDSFKYMNTSLTSPLIVAAINPQVENFGLTDLSTLHRDSAFGHVILILPHATDEYLSPDLYDQLRNALSPFQGYPKVLFSRMKTFLRAISFASRISMGRVSICEPEDATLSTLLANFSAKTKTEHTKFLQIKSRAPPSTSNIPIIPPPANIPANILVHHSSLLRSQMPTSLPTPPSSPWDSTPVPPLIPFSIHPVNSIPTFLQSQFASQPAAWPSSVNVIHNTVYNSNASVSNTAGSETSSQQYSINSTPYPANLPAGRGRNLLAIQSAFPSQSMPSAPTPSVPSLQQFAAPSVSPSISVANSSLPIGRGRSLVTSHFPIPNIAHQPNPPSVENFSFAVQDSPKLNVSAPVSNLTNLPAGRGRRLLVSSVELPPGLSSSTVVSQIPSQSETAGNNRSSQVSQFSVASKPTILHNNTSKSDGRAKSGFDANALRQTLQLKQNSASAEEKKKINTDLGPKMI